MFPTAIQTKLDEIRVLLDNPHSLSLHANIEGDGLVYGISYTMTAGGTIEQGSKRVALPPE